jgi:cytochrome c oxidase subunit 4
VVTVTTDSHIDAHVEQLDHHADAAHDEHWTDRQYVILFLALAFVTGVEVLFSYIRDDMGAAFLPLLLALMIGKFFAVVLFFMHLKFDNKLFGIMFYTGLGLALFVYSVALFTFKFFSS